MTQSGTIKTCSKCKKEKPEESFRKSKHTPDGRAAVCRDCGPISFKERLKYNPICTNCGKNPHGKNSQWCDACRNHYLKQTRIKLAGSWYRNLTDEQRKKRRARSALVARVWRGSIASKPCEWCGDPKTEADHYRGYDGENAFKVLWLCKTHHTERTYGKIYVDVINFREVLVRKLSDS